MNPHHAYRQVRSVGWTRMDLLLALYDGAIERLGQAREAMLRQDQPTVVRLTLRCQRIVCELTAALDMQRGAIARNLQSLYAHVLEQLAQPTPQGLDAALAVLTELRDGWMRVRDDAVRLEREGQIPPTESTVSVSASV